MAPNLDPDDDDYPNFSPHRNSYGLSSKIMVTAFVSLFVVILLIIVLHAYARYFLLRRARRRAALRQVGLGAAQVRSAEPPNTGLEPSVITSFPIFVYKTNINDADDDYGGLTKDCSVCLISLEDEDMVRLLPNCRHFFHAECIDKWLNLHSTCPICRTEAKHCLQPEPHEDPVRGDAPSAPSLERMGIASCKMEGTSIDDGIPTSEKGNGSSSRLSSFRRMLSRERSSRRIQLQDGVQDLERQ